MASVFGKHPPFSTPELLPVSVVHPLLSTVDALSLFILAVAGALHGS